MADFQKFGQTALDLASAFAGNCDRGDIAGFLIAQRAAVQADAIKSRTEGGGKAAPQGGQKPAGGGQQASGAMARLKALTGGK